MCSDVVVPSRCRRIIRHLLHSTAKAHSAAHKITAVIEIHAHVRIFFCRLLHRIRKLILRIVQDCGQGVLRSLGQRLAAGRILLVQAPSLFSKILLRSSASRSGLPARPAFVRSIFRSASNCICCRNSLSCISSSALQFRSVTITLGSSRCASSISFLCCVNISCVVILRSVSKFRLHIFFQVFFYVQLAVTALAPIRCGVGDVLAAVRPSGVVTLRAEQYQKFLTVSCAAHTLVDHAHQFKLPTLTFGCRVVFRVGHPAGLPLLILLEFRQSEFLADLVIARRAAPESARLPCVPSCPSRNSRC